MITSYSSKEKEKSLPSVHWGLVFIMKKKGSGRQLVPQIKRFMWTHNGRKTKKKYRIHLLLIHGQNLHDEQLLSVLQYLDNCPCHCSEPQEMVMAFFSLDVLSWKFHLARESVYRENWENQTKLGGSPAQKSIGNWQPMRNHPTDQRTFAPL